MKNNNGYFYYVILSPVFKNRTDALNFEIERIVNNNIPRGRLSYLKTQRGYRIIRRIHYTEIIKLNNHGQRILDQRWLRNIQKQNKKIEQWVQSGKAEFMNKEEW
jgi:hypothetical protein